MRDLKQIRDDAMQLKPEEQVQLAVFLLKHSQGRALKSSPNLSEFKGSIRLTIDPKKHQTQLRTEWS